MDQRALAVTSSLYHTGPSICIGIASFKGALPSWMKTQKPGQGK